MQRRCTLLLALIVAVGGLATGSAAHGTASAPPTPAAGGATGPSVPLPDHVPTALAGATLLKSPPQPAGVAAPDPAVSLTVVLQRSDEAGFAAYLAGVQDHTSVSYRHFAAQDELARRFGPTQQAYDAVLGYLRSRGFRLVEGSANRLTVTVAGTRSQAEQAFNVQIGDYVLGNRHFAANSTNPSLPAGIAAFVRAIIGLSTLAQPRPALSTITRPAGGLGGTSPTLEAPLVAPSPAFPAALAAAYDFGGVALPGGGAATGTGQTVGIVAFDNFADADVQNWLSLAGLPASTFNNVGRVAVSGGSIVSNGEGTEEVLLDVDTVLGLAPGARAIVYHAPNTGVSYQALLNAMLAPASGVTVISNSWFYCENDTAPADARSVDALIAQAAASGISTFSASGDTENACNDGTPDGAAGVVGVPADSPNGIAVGGTSLQVNATNGYLSESYWDSGSGGGFGASASGFFTRPGYQNGFASGATRSLPDVAAVSDPADGINICQANTGGTADGIGTHQPTGNMGGCPDQRGGGAARHGGTSLAAPVWAAGTALINQALGHGTGNLAPSLYALSASGPTAFHAPSAMTGGNNDFAHLGLGSFDLGHLATALSTVSSALAVSSIMPVSGPSNGGTVVTITGSGFSTAAGATTVSFGAAAGTAINCASTTSCAATSPIGAASTMVDVRVTIGGQVSAAVTADRFTYSTQPATSVWQQLSPARDPGQRSDSAVSYDEFRHVVVLFGGTYYQGSNVIRANDTWTWDGTNWTPICGTTIAGAIAACGPTGRYGASIAYDAARGSVVLFGGGTESEPLNDTWVFTGTGWSQLHPAVSPPTHCQAAMAYDRVHSLTVLFGGGCGPANQVGNRPLLADTWTWNGSNWTPVCGASVAQATSPCGPSARVSASAGYDAAHGVIVLFGGLGANGTNLSDTWIWNGSGWQLQSPVSSPFARYLAGMAYDGGGGNVVLFGGSVYGSVAQQRLSDTWTWNGTTWTQQLRDTAPPVRTNASLVYSPANNGVLLFGGSVNGGLDNTTWLWTPGVLPPHVASVKPNYGPAAGGTVVTITGTDLTSATATTVKVGGVTATNVSCTSTTSCTATVPPGSGVGDVVATTGGQASTPQPGGRFTYIAARSAAWVQQYPATQPAPREQAGLARAAQGSDVLFGGLNSAGSLGDTWAFDGDDWQLKSSTSGVSARSAPAMSPNPTGAGTILFGGSAGSSYNGETWAFDGNGWTQKPISGPSPRAGASMATDTANHVAILFGGVRSSGFSGETWAFDGTGWTQKTAIGTPPPPRSSAGMVYLPGTGQIVLFGGTGFGGTLLGDTWIWNGSTWNAVCGASGTPVCGPAARQKPAMAYDAATGTAVMFGGFDNTTYLADTWTWDGGRWTSQSPAVSPPGRGQASIADGSVTQPSTLFGGVAVGNADLNDTWLWVNATAPPSLGCTSVSAGTGQTSPQPAGTTVTLTGAAVGCLGPLYRFWVQDPDVGWALAQDYSESPGFTWHTTGLHGGTYLIEVDAKRQGSSLDQETATTLRYTLIPAPCTAATLLANPPSPEPPGPTITLTATATCGGSALYRFWFQDPDLGWQVLRPYAPSPTANWPSLGKPLASYWFAVDVENRGAAVDYETETTLRLSLADVCGAVAITPSLAPPQKPGVQLAVTGTAACPGGTEYRVWLQDPQTGWKLVQNYSASASYAWNTTGLAKGNYWLEVDARRAGSSADYESFGEAVYTLGDYACRGTTLSTDAGATAAAGTVVTLQGSADCGGTAQYRFWVQDPNLGWQVVADYGVGSTYRWSTAGLAPGAYWLEADSRNQGSRAEAEDLALLRFVVTAAGGGAQRSGAVPAGPHPSGSGPLASPTPAAKPVKGTPSPTPTPPAPAVKPRVAPVGSGRPAARPGVPAPSTPTPTPPSGPHGGPPLALP